MIYLKIFRKPCETLREARKHERQTAQEIKAEGK